jgi:hypothetical protein
LGDVLPAPSVNHEDVDSTGRTREVERQPASSVMFTSLEEYKQKGEWARPWLVLTHYPDLHNNPLGHPAPSEPNVDAKGKAEVVIDPTAPPQAHPVVLMRGEISPSSTKSPVSSPLPSTDLALTQAEAQLLALGLQRFYCSTVQVGRESDVARREREEREALLRGFGKEGWDWNAWYERRREGIDDVHRMGTVSFSTDDGDVTVMPPMGGHVGLRVVVSNRCDGHQD